MKQQNTCATPLTVATPDVVQPAPGNVMLDITKAWKYSTGAGVTVGLIDTGVTPNPRFPALFAGGDYVMGDAERRAVRLRFATAPSSPRSSRRSRRIRRPSPPPMPAGCRAAATATGGRRPSPFPTTPPPATPKPTHGDGHRAAAAACRTAGRRHRRNRRARRRDPARARCRPCPGPPPGSPDGVVGVAPDVALISVRQSSAAFGPARPATRRQRRDPPQGRRHRDAGAGGRAPGESGCEGHEHLGGGVHQRRRPSRPGRARARRSATPPSRRTSSSWPPRATRAKARRAARTRCSTRCVPTIRATGRTCRRSSRPRGSPITSSTVGAVSPDGQPLPQSIAGPWVGVAAPGLRDHGPVQRQRCAGQRAARPEPGKAVPFWGTSFAAAYTCGVAALVRAKYPQLSLRTRVIRRITETAHNPPRGVDNKVGYGVIDPVAALTFDVPLGDRLPPEQLTTAPERAQPPPPPGSAAAAHRADRCRGRCRARVGGRRRRGVAAEDAREGAHRRRLRRRFPGGRRRGRRAGRDR